MRVQLHGYFRSSASYRVRIALHLKGIEVPPVTVELRAPASAQRSAAFLAINPHGLVPALAVGDAVLTQSLAIIEYLEEKYPQPPLLPGDALQRAQVRAAALSIACDIHPLGNLRVQNYLRSALHADEAAVLAWYRHWIALGFAALESQARQLSADRRHLYGSTVTLADVFLVPQMYNARRFNCDLQPYPLLCEICAHLESLSAFARAAPEAQPDAS